MLGLLVRIVDACGRRAWLVALAALLLVAGSVLVIQQRLGVDTDTDNLISPQVPWRRAEAALDKAFPQNTDTLAVVIDGATPGVIEDAAEALTQALRKRPDRFRYVYRPDGGPFFAKNGILYLSTAEVQSVADQMIAAQPLIGTVNADPTARGLMTSLGLALEGVKQGEMPIAEFAHSLGPITAAIRAGLAGKPALIAWENLLTGHQPTPEETRKFILVQPVLDYEALAPGGAASATIRQLADTLKLTPDHGVRVRLTGPVALSDDEFSTVSQSAGTSTALSVGLVILILFLALGSWRLIVPILLTLAAGLALTTAFAALAVGSLNLISIAFGVLFIGIAVDFSIQFGVRARDERFRHGTLPVALRQTAAAIGGPLGLAALSTMLGFLSFTPTDYSGVSELGLIAGTGMLIAFVLNVTLLPALLTLFKPPGEAHPAGFAWAAPVDRVLVRHRRWVLAAAVAVAAGSLALLPGLRFDFNPLNLKDPHTESVSTMFELIRDATTSPFTVDVLTPSFADAARLGEQLSARPEVARAVSISDFIPDDQDSKLAILADARDLMGPTLALTAAQPPPTDAELVATLNATRAKLQGLPNKPPALVEFDAALGDWAAAAPDVRDRIAAELMTGWPERMAALRASLSAERVTLSTLPDDLWANWVAADGSARLEVFPKGNTLDNAVLRRFVDAVRAIAPDATGSAVTMQESGRTIVRAFVEAGAIALVAMIVLLAVVLRRARDVALVMAPLLLAAIMTGAISVLIGLPLNYANVIAVPLLLGIGVSFAIYLVAAWRQGRTDPLQSPTARAVLFSACTTMSAFGSLATSPHRGTAAMGTLLAIALTLTLAATLFVLPALMGPPRRR